MDSIQTLSQPALPFSPQGLKRSLAISLSGHALVALLFAWMWSASIGPFQPSLRKAPKTVWIDLAPQAPTKTQARPKETPSTRIVQTEKIQRTALPAPDAFMGEQTQTVDRQTVSRNQKTQIGLSHSKAAKAPPSQTTPAPLAKLGVSGLLKPGSILTKPPVPQTQWAEAAPGSSAPQDFVKGLKEGERTALNTKEFVFFGYFQRIRSNLDRAWNKTLRENMERFFRRGRHLASEIDHTTRTLVVLNGVGKVLRVKVLEESGTQDLDDAAVRAFNEAGPFPNPPRGLMDTNGEISVRWDFVLRN